MQFHNRPKPKALHAEKPSMAFSLPKLRCKKTGQGKSLSTATLLEEGGKAEPIEARPSLRLLAKQSERTCKAHRLGRATSRWTASRLHIHLHYLVTNYLRLDLKVRGCGFAQAVLRGKAICPRKSRDGSAKKNPTFRESCYGTAWANINKPETERAISLQAYRPQALSCLSDCVAKLASSCSFQLQLESMSVLEEVL